MKHILAHALNPAETGCRCDMKDITNCVLCERRLAPDREHVDTCGEPCFKRLRTMQGGAE